MNEYLKSRMHIKLLNHCYGHAKKEVFHFRIKSPCTLKNLTPVEKQLKISIFIGCFLDIFLVHVRASLIHIDCVLIPHATLTHKTL